MRKYICGVLLAACFAGAAAAQGRQEPSVEQAQLSGEQQDAPLGGEDIIRHYPPDALTQGIGGLAEVTCSSNGQCRVTMEVPRDLGFGQAVLAIIREQPMQAPPDSEAAGLVRRIMRFDPGPPPTITDASAEGERVVWRHRPGVADFRRYYPRAALYNGIEGRVVLNCVVNADHTLECQVVSEIPSGRGFGEATLRLAQHFEIAPQTQQGTETVGARVHVPIRWSIRR